MKVLVTGGAGYIGSTICSALEDSGHIPIVLDSLVTGKAEFVKNRYFYQQAKCNKMGIFKNFAKRYNYIFGSSSAVEQSAVNIENTQPLLVTTRR